MTERNLSNVDDPVGLLASAKITNGKFRLSASWKNRVVADIAVIAFDCPLSSR